MIRSASISGPLNGRTTTVVLQTSYRLCWGSVKVHNNNDDNHFAHVYTYFYSLFAWYISCTPSRLTVSRHELIELEKVRSETFRDCTGKSGIQLTRSVVRPSSQGALAIQKVNKVMMMLTHYFIYCSVCSGLITLQATLRNYGGGIRPSSWINWQLID